MKLNKTKTESVLLLLNDMIVWFEILLHIDIPHCNMQHPFEARRVNLKTCLSKMRPRSRSSIGHCIERHYGDFFRIRCPFPRHSDSEPGKRKRSAESGASALMGGLATNKITTFLVEAEAEAALKSQNPHPCSELLENWTKIFHCPTSSGASEQASEQCGASEWVSGTSERVIGRVSGPLLMSWFQEVLSHSARPGWFQSSRSLFGGVCLNGRLLRELL